jgi:hypothetical protein
MATPATLKITNVSGGDVQVPGGTLASGASRDVSLDLILGTSYYQKDLADQITAGDITVEYQGQVLSAQQVEDLELTVGSVLRQRSASDQVWYVDKATGSDSNDGLTPGTAWENLTYALDRAQKYEWFHDLVIHSEGSHTIDPFYATSLKGRKNITIDGGPNLTVISGPHTSDIGGAGGRTIGLSTLGLTPNAHSGQMVVLGNLGGSPGPLTGEKVTIKRNTATTISTCAAFSADPLGYDFEIVTPASVITVNGAPFDFVTQGRGGRWYMEGYGFLWLQRFTFEGNVPLNCWSGEGATFYVASSVINKPQALGNLWHAGWFCAEGPHGYVNTPRDPADVTGATALPLDKAGVGEAGGDASLLFYGILCEYCNSFLDFSGSFAQQVIVNVASGLALRIRDKSHVNQLGLANCAISDVAASRDCSFGGYVPTLVTFGAMPGIWLTNSNVALEGDVDFSNAPYGIYGRRSHVRFDGGPVTDSGGITGFFLFMTDGSDAYYDAAAVVTATGAAGDISFDGLVAYPGGHAAVLAGTPARDVTHRSSARISSLFGT